MCCGAAKNLVTAAISAPEIFSWFRDAITGIVKCFNKQQIYNDDNIIKNRADCGNCEHSTKTDGKLTVQSQCMAPDPNKENAPCGCFIVCKTMVDKCPLNKWTSTPVEITLRNKPIMFSNESDIIL